MSIPFQNDTGKTQFHGEFVLDGTKYEYILYLIPSEGRIPASQKREIVHFFGNRMFKGSVCLGVDINTVRDYINNRNVSAFVRVKSSGVDNEASGTLQIFNHCGSAEPDIWVNDVCRVGSERGGDPVNALFFFIEQLVLQNRNKTNVKLYVEREPKNLAFLKDKYEKLGFVRNADVDPDVCSEWEHEELVMEKTGLVPRLDIIDFSFLRSPSVPIHIPNKRTRRGGTRTRTKRRTRTHTTRTKRR